ncbi:DNA replication/repair protein RecF [Immundisolibacter sp.]|uniref:DNA replication/repair protein RecF n=1 Tax=Immundisolibacter sp. TaxID=1934948 RepID=UPI0026250ABE|nr:DNA replication and repair protein RecF [Immundisolibacter sp.]MDD3651936.1 DNA replication and repair protein RecF [Immundisolibacter sp.]
MRLTRLIVRDVRNLQAIDWHPADGLNVLVGPNGGGKSSLLEAIHLAAVGRSFRTRDTDAMIRQGCKGLSVGAWFRHEGGQLHHVRLQRQAGATRIFLDQRPLRSASELARNVPVLALSQDGLARFRSSRGERRAVLDWGLFHVEPGFHSAWSRYYQSLAQRNAALRARQVDAPWLGLLAQAGEALTVARLDYVARLQQQVEDTVHRLGLGFSITITLQRGWRDGEPLTEYWASSRDRDRAVGYTMGGPHRANLVARVDGRFGFDVLSAGQAKLVYLVVRLAQLEQLLACFPQAEPIVFFDDLAAELDERHLQAVLRLLSDHRLQRFVTSPTRAGGLGVSGAVFHVEHGAVTPVSF